jgi:lipopolysaccharide export system ATP-binding protein
MPPCLAGAALYSRRKAPISLRRCGGGRGRASPTPPLDSGMLSVQHLVKSLSGRRIIEDVTLCFEPGEVVGLLGPNGAGKTTSFRMLTGLVVPDAGRIELNRVDITRTPFYERARRGIAFLPQDSFVPRSLTVAENMDLVLEVRQPARSARQQVFDELVSQFHLEPLLKMRVGTLSSGQRRRCEIAIIIACNPQYALLDEPFARVDPQMITEITGLIRELTTRDIGVLITDHNAREMFQLVDRAYVIDSGRVLAHGTAETLVNNVHVRRVYLGEDFRI